MGTSTACPLPSLAAPPDAERTEALSADHAAAIADEDADRFRRDGFVVLRDVIPADAVAAARNQLARDLAAKMASSGIAAVQRHPHREANPTLGLDFVPVGGNHDVNRWNLLLASQPCFLREEILAPRRVLALIDTLLGADAAAVLLGADVPMPGSGFQATHQDFFRFGLTVNVPLVPVRDRDGPVELWPGSHTWNGGPAAFHRGQCYLSQVALSGVRERVAAVRPHLDPGDVLVRDQRLVHRGTPNLGSDPRLMISLWFKALAPRSWAALNWPIPAGRLTDWCARRAKAMRQAAINRPSGTALRLRNLGNLYGRVIDEVAGSDRHGFRAVPADLWTTLSTPCRHLLRHARIEGSPPPRGHLSGTCALAATAAGFALAGVAAQALDRLRPRGR